MSRCAVVDDVWGQCSLDEGHNLPHRVGEDDMCTFLAGEPGHIVVYHRNVAPHLAYERWASADRPAVWWGLV